MRSTGRQTAGPGSIRNCDNRAASAVERLDHHASAGRIGRDVDGDARFGLSWRAAWRDGCCTRQRLLRHLHAHSARITAMASEATGTTKDEDDRHTSPTSPVARRRYADAGRTAPRFWRCRRSDGTRRGSRSRPRSPIMGDDHRDTREPVGQRSGCDYCDTFQLEISARPRRRQTPQKRADRAPARDSPAPTLAFEHSTVPAPVPWRQEGPHEGRLVGRGWDRGASGGLPRASPGFADDDRHAGVVRGPELVGIWPDRRMPPIGQ